MYIRNGVNEQQPLANPDIFCLFFFCSGSRADNPTLSSFRGSFIIAMMVVVVDHFPLYFSGPTHIVCNILFLIRKGKASSISPPSPLLAQRNGTSNHNLSTTPLFPQTHPAAPKKPPPSFRGVPPPKKKSQRIFFLFKFRAIKQRFRSRVSPPQSGSLDRASRERARANC